MRCCEVMYGNVSHNVWWCGLRTKTSNRDKYSGCTSRPSDPEKEPKGYEEYRACDELEKRY